MTVDVIDPQSAINRDPLLYIENQEPLTSSQEEAIVKAGGIYMISLINSILAQIEEVLHTQLKVMNYREEQFSQEQAKGNEKIQGVYKSLAIKHSLGIIGAGLTAVGAFLNQASVTSKLFAQGGNATAAIEKVLTTFSEKDLHECQQSVKEAEKSSGRLVQDENEARKKLEALQERLLQAVNALNSIVHKTLS